MKLRKASEEPEERAQPVSFRLSVAANEKLDIISMVLDKSKSKIVQELILGGYDEVLKDYPKDVRDTEAKLKKSAHKSK